MILGLLPSLLLLSHHEPVSSVSFCHFQWRVLTDASVKNSVLHGKAKAAMQKCQDMKWFLVGEWWICTRKAIPVGDTKDEFQGHHLEASYVFQEFSPLSLEDFWLSRVHKAQLFWHFSRAFLALSAGNGPLACVSAMLHLYLWQCSSQTSMSELPGKSAPPWGGFWFSTLGWDQVWEPLLSILHYGRFQLICSSTFPDRLKFP